MTSPVPANIPTPTARERAVEVLSRHFAEDGITMDEFERRVELVYRAATDAELQALIADVPSVTTAVDRASTERKNVIDSDDRPATGRIRVVLSSTERRGPTKMPRHLYVLAALGNAELDLSQADFAPGVTTIQVKAILGNVEIRVPHGARVEINCNAFLAAVEAPGPGAAEGAHGKPSTVIRVMGSAILSHVGVTSAGSGLLDDDGEGMPRLNG